MLRLFVLSVLATFLLDANGLPSICQSQEAAQGAAHTPSTAPSTLSNPSTLADGTEVRLRLIEDLSSANAAFGESVGFEVLEDVELQDIIVIPCRAMAWGTVTEVRRKSRMARSGRLTVKIDAVRLADGEVVPLRAIAKSKDNRQSDAMKTELEQTTLSFFPAAPLALLMRGEDITIPKGTEVAAYVNGNTALDLRRFESQDWERQESRTANVVTDLASLGVVQVMSTPPGAEIVVDGKYMGGTPAVVRLDPGDHKIQLNKAGYKTWERIVTLTPRGSEFLNPILEAQ
ncbi:MAG: PEGA domain-containing protein [Candidatus Acidiferrum sp.]